MRTRTKREARRMEATLPKGEERKEEAGTKYEDADIFASNVVDWRVIQDSSNIEQ